jgi:hypothetical protein
MTRRKRTPRAKNKITGSTDGALIPIGPDPFPDAPAQVQRVKVITVARSTLFTAELEAVIEIIARERVRQSMMDRLGRRLLSGPTQAMAEVPRADN